MRVLVVICLCAIFIFDVAADVEDWAVYKTDNFTFYSDQKEEHVKKSLEDLEIVRAALMGLLKLDTDTRLLPVQIYSFRSQRDYLAISPRNVGGYFGYSQTGPVMVISPENKGRINSRVLYHEYVHYLMRSIYSANFPTWYDEGIAEFYSTLKIVSDTIVVGLEPKGQTRPGLVEIDKLLFETNESKKRRRSFEEKFYSSSWLLVHFLSLSSVNGFDDYRTAMQKFLFLQNKGMQVKDAFKEAFTISIDELQNQLNSYSRKRQLYGYKISKPNVTLRYTSHKLSLADTYVSLSKLAFDSGKKDNSEKYLKLALKHNSALAFSIKSFLAARQNNETDALNFIKLALENKSIFAETYLNIAQAYIAIAKNNAAIKEEMNSLALRYLEKAKESGTMPRTSIYLAELYWQQGKQQQAVDEILSLVKLTPADLRANYVAGDYMVRINNKKYAEFFLNNVINWSHSERLSQQALDMLDSLPQ
jgi:hypothetical protein